jgi:hypothetical protein
MFVLITILSINVQAKDCGQHKTGLKKLTDFIEEVKGKPLNIKDEKMRKK